MAWFSDAFHFDKTALKVAHITDCHLSKDIHGEYFSVNTAAYFARCLQAIAEQNADCVVFGGDLTQDHSSESYQLFAKLIEDAALNCPVFWLPGNHDELFEYEALTSSQILSSKRITFLGGQLLLVNSKGSTPAGWVTQTHLNELSEAIGQVPSVVFCHHNPLPIQAYLDKHMLENGPQFLNTCVNSQQCIGVFHGHVHHEYTQNYRDLSVFATPASSIQFTKHTMAWQQEDLGPAFRLINLNIDGQQNLLLSTDVVWLNE